jgi:type II secretory pathway pseudopilin PulG
MNKKDKGFLLIETALAVAILAATTVFSVNVFLVSAKAHDKAENIAIATERACSAVELLRSGEYVPSTVYYDEHWQQTDTNPRFQVVCEETREEGKYLGSIAEFSETSLSYYTRNPAVVKNFHVSVTDLAEKNEEKKVLADYVAYKYEDTAR